MEGASIAQFDIKTILENAKDCMFNFKFEDDSVVCECINHESTEKRPRKTAVKKQKSPHQIWCGFFVAFFKKNHMFFKGAY